MDLWRRLTLYLTHRFQRPARLSFRLDQEHHLSLVQMTGGHKRRKSDTVHQMLRSAVNKRRTAKSRQACWNALSEREKQVVLLILQKRTTRQIADRLVLSPETVKSHLSNILNKFGLSNKSELADFLAGLDLGAAELPEQPGKS